MKVWVVTGATGEYEQTWNTAIKVYLDRTKAYAAATIIDEYNKLNWSNKTEEQAIEEAKKVCEALKVPFDGYNGFSVDEVEAE